MSRGGKNAYLEQRRAEINVYRQAEKDTYIQYMTDMLMVTLNDPDVMGKDVFGAQRIAKIVDAMGKKFDQYHGALEDIPEDDYFQELLDRRLRPIAGERFAPFTDRYKWIKRIFYR